MGHFLLSKGSATTALDISEWALVASGLLLLVGICGEYSKFPKILRGPKEWYVGLVILSIAGEFLADGGIFAFSRQLQVKSDAEVTDLGSRLELANGALTRALNKAADALSLAEKAEHDAGDAKNSATNSVALARTDTETAISAAVDNMTHRHLTASQKKNLTRKFSRYQRVSLQIKLVNPDEESERLAKDLQPVFPHANISRFSSSVRFKGMQIIVLRGVNREEGSFAYTLESALGELFQDVQPQRRLEPDWGNVSNMSGDYFKPPLEPAIVELAIGKK